MNKLYAWATLTALFNTGLSVGMKKEKPLLRRVKKSFNVHKLLIEATTAHLEKQGKKTIPQSKQQPNK